MPIEAIVTDIEGTTTDIQFVHKVLFPYAYDHMASFVTEHEHDAQVAPVLSDVRAEMQRPNATLSEVIEQLQTWIREDKKITPLKTLQGLMWQVGYENGDFTGHLYPEVAAHLKRWHEQHLKLYVYSSGSEKAQKLLFGYSDAGDLTPLFDGYFDTRIGHKREMLSYASIAKTIGIEPGNILFLSDIPEELDAAHSAGMRTLHLIRPGTLACENHWSVADFAEVDCWLCEECG